MDVALQPVGAWMSDSFSRLKDRLLTLSLLSIFGCFMIVIGVVLVYALAVVFIGLLQGWDYLGRLLVDPTRLGYVWDGSRGALALFNVLALFVALRIYCWILLAAIHASIDPAPRFRESLRKGKGRGYAFLALFVVQQALLQIGVLLFILPGLILGVWLGFAFWAFARERTGAFASLGASARAVKGHFFGVLGRMLLVGLVGMAMMIVPVVGWLVGGSWMCVAWGALYEQLRGPAPQPSRPPFRPQPARPLGVQPAAAPQQ